MKQQEQKQLKRSPLTASPLRNPGQSLDEEITRIMDEDVSPLIVIAILVLILTLFEWWRWYFKVPPQPMLFTLVAIGVWAYSFKKLLKVRKTVKFIKQARDGEKAVGQFLEQLREQGYRVLHDLVGEGFNVDHVLVGPAGVFTIETKTISKPVRGKAEITYDCKNITIGGFSPDRDPIIQGKAQAHWLRGILEGGMGKQYKIQSVVVYPGWFIRRVPENAKCEVLVLNPKMLPSLLEKSFHKLSQEETGMINYHLSRYVRTSEHKSDG